MPVVYTDRVHPVNMISVHTMCEHAPMSEMSERLKEARTKAGYASARSAALKFGWPVSTYGAHENGQNDYDAEAAAKYAKAYRVSPGYLLTGEDPPISAEDREDLALLREARQHGILGEVRKYVRFRLSETE
jgi:transcriptional regulator with XRE-family HTH domain